MLQRMSADADRSVDWSIFCLPRWYINNYADLIQKGETGILNKGY
jgi:hypothetical protein